MLCRKGKKFSKGRLLSGDELGFVIGRDLSLPSLPPSLTDDQKVTRLIDTLDECISRRRCWSDNDDDSDDDSEITCQIGTGYRPFSHILCAVRGGYILADRVQSYCGAFELACNKYLDALLTKLSIEDVHIAIERMKAELLPFRQSELRWIFIKGAVSSCSRLYPHEFPTLKESMSGVVEDD